MHYPALHDIVRFVPIDERLVTAGQPSEEQLAMVAAEGFEVVINLGLHDDKRYALKDEAGTVHALGMRYVHIPVQFAAPTEEDLDRFFCALDEARGSKVFVHCAHNKRVSVFIALDRILRHGWEMQNGLDAMNAVWQPDEIWSRFLHDVLASRR